MRNLPLKLLASVLVFVAATGTAAAQDQKNYSGVHCRGSGGSNASVVYNANWGRADAAVPFAAPNLPLYCPAVKDGNSIQSAAIWVIDQRANRPLICVLRSGRHNGPAMWMATDMTTIPYSDPNPTPLTYGALPGVFLGHYWFTCMVPGYNVDGEPSSVVVYRVTELP